MRRSQLAVAVLSAVGCSSTVAPRPAAAPERGPPATADAWAPPATAVLTGGRLALTATGALVIDADSGVLVATDRAGTVTARRPIGRGAGLLVHDDRGGRAYVVDRTGDRVVVVDVADGLREVARWPTPAEPFGIALTPDRRTVVVTTIADHRLVALDADTGAERWRARLAAGPRGVSIAPDGLLALVSSVATGDLELVELGGEHRVATIPYDLACERCQETGAVARGTGAVRFLDEHRAVATYQRSIPEALLDRRTGLYGGGADPPVTQHVAMLTFSTDPARPGVAQRVARVAEHQPRVFAWDAARDTLYVAGHGSDTLLVLRGYASADDGAVEDAADSFALGAMGRCGPDGGALGPDGDLYLWCAFTRTLLRLHGGELRQSPPLVASAMTPAQHRGMVLFYKTTQDINRDRALACSSCHIEGGADGLSWKIGERPLQTPALAGRLAGTAPYKWTATDATLEASFATTIKRLGGRGITSNPSDDLAAYLTSLPPARPPTLDADAVARGRAVFEGAGGCTRCHRGPAYSDGATHTLSELITDTPSLLGLAATAPYFHDGSAPTLEALVAGAGTIQGMGNLDQLTAEQRADLRTFLESL